MRSLLNRLPRIPLPVVAAILVGLLIGVGLGRFTFLSGTPSRTTPSLSPISTAQPNPTPTTPSSPTPVPTAPTSALERFASPEFWFGVAGNLAASFLIVLFLLIWRPTRERALRVASRLESWLWPAPIGTLSEDVYSFDPLCHVVRYSGRSGFRFQCHYSKRPVSLKDARLVFLLRQVNQHAAKTAWANQKSYALVKLGSTPHDVHDEPLLQLHLAQTDYFTFQATNMKLNEPLDDGPALVRSLLPDAYRWKEPVRSFSNCFSVNLLVLTTDGQLVICHRPDDPTKMGMYTNRYSISMGETLNPEKDPFDQIGRFLTTCAARGAEEELGCSDVEETISFFILQVTEEYSQWGLVGLAYTGKTFEEIRRRDPSTTHRWECDSLHGVPFNPTQTAAALKNLASKPDQWVPGTLAAVALGLIHRNPRQGSRVIDSFTREFGRVGEVPLPSDLAP
jgi:hypothetical protein